MEMLEKIIRNIYPVTYTKYLEKLTMYAIKSPKGIIKYTGCPQKQLSDEKKGHSKIYIHI